MHDNPLITLNNRLTLREAGRLASVSPSAVFRWIDQGLHGVKLRHARLGRRLYTSEAALTEFMNRVAEAREVTKQQ